MSGAPGPRDSGPRDSGTGGTSQGGTPAKGFTKTAYRTGPGGPGGSRANADARVLESVRTTVNVLPDSAAALLKFEKALLAGDYVLVVALSDAKGRPLGWNEWRFTVEEP